MNQAKPRSKAARWGIYVAGGVAALCLALVLTLALIDWNILKGPLERMASARFGREVRIQGPLQVHIWSRRPTVSLNGLVIGNAPWESSRPMATVERATIQLELGPLFAGHVVLRRVELVRPDVYLHQEKSGRANWTFENKAPTKTPASGPTRLPAMRDLVIESGKLLLVDELRRLKVEGTIVARAQALHGDPRPFRIQGKGTINEEPFRLDVAGGALQALSPDKPYPFTLSILAGESHIEAEGRVLKPFDLGGLDLKVDGRGRDLAELFYLTQITLPNTPPFRLRAHIARRGQKIAVRDIAGSLGGSDVSGTMDIDASTKRPTVKADLSSRHLFLTDFAAITGNKAQAHANSLDQNRPGAQAAPTAPPPPARHLFPDARLEVERLRAVDADVRFQATSIEAGNLPFTRVSVHTRLDDGVLTLDPVEFDMAEGRFSSSVRIDSHQSPPQVQLDLRASGVRLGQFKPRKANAEPPVDGTLDARAEIEGRGDSIHSVLANANGRLTVIVPDGDVRAAFAELTGVDVTRGIGLLLKKPDDRAPIRCGVAEFAVQNGTARAQNLVFDTQDVLITGRGQIDLGPEKLDLKIEGEPKKVRLVRLRAPIDVKGEILRPSFGLEAGPVLKQGAIAAALGTLLSPLAAIIAFVDPGLAKNENCAQLLAQAQAQAPQADGSAEELR